MTNEWTQESQEFEHIHGTVRVLRTLSKKEIKCPCSIVLQRRLMLTNIYSLQLYLLLPSTYTYLRSIYTFERVVRSASIECKHIKRAVATLKIASKSALLQCIPKRNENIYTAHLYPNQRSKRQLDTIPRHFEA